MTIQPGAMVYTQSFGSRPENVEVPFLSNPAPTTFDVKFPVGKRWIDKTNGNAYNLVMLTSNVSGTSATWVFTGGLTAQPSTFTTITTTGDIVDGGNITFANALNGPVYTAAVATAGASPRVANGRAGAATFSGVSIAAGATQAFTITNSAVTGAATQILYALYGATSGSALTIQSVVNSAGSSLITVTNGTGATTTTANITFVFEVLN